MRCSEHGVPASDHLSILLVRGGPKARFQARECRVGNVTAAAAAAAAEESWVGKGGVGEEEGVGRGVARAEAESSAQRLLFAHLNI